MAVLSTHLYAQVVLPRTSGLPEDVVTNTFHFKRDIAQTFLTAAAVVGNALAGFYTTNTLLGSNVGASINGTIARTVNGCLIKIYDGSVAPNLRVPVTTTFTMSASGVSQPFPSEVACCLSFRGSDPTVPKPIQRGRVYIGPLGVDSAAIGITGDLRVNSVIQAQLRQSATVHLGSNIGGLNVRWAVYSPTANILTQCAFVSTDDAYDIQRRRGLKASAKTEVLVP